MEFVVKFPFAGGVPPIASNSAGLIRLASEAGLIRVASEAGPIRVAIAMRGVIYIHSIKIGNIVFKGRIRKIA